MFNFLEIFNSEFINYYYGLIILCFCFAVTFTAMTTSKYSTLEKTVLWAVSTIIVITIILILGINVKIDTYIDFSIYAYLITSGVFGAMCLLISNNSMPEKLFKIFTNISMFIILHTLSILIAKLILPNENTIMRYWLYVSARTALYLIYTLVYLLVIKKKLPQIEYKHKNRWWPYVFVALIFVILFTYLTAIVKSAWDFEISDFITFGVATFGFGVVYSSVLFSINMLNKAEKFSLMEQNEKYMKQQLDSLVRAEEDAKKTRHDIRHHNMVILEYAKNGEDDKIISYISDYDQDLRTKALVRYCENDIVNNIVISYKDLFEKENIKFTFECEVPKETKIIDIDYVVILANSLENALHGCKESKKDDKECSLLIKIKNDKMSILIKNTCSDKVEVANGKMVNSGIGISSMFSVLEKYDGEMEYEKEENTLTQKILINI